MTRQIQTHLMLLAAAVSFGAGVYPGALFAALQDLPPDSLPEVTRQDGEPVFKSQTDLVVLHVNVFDGKSDAVPELPRSAFQVIEDGRPQEISFFNAADVPVAVGLVIDNSSSMLTRRPMVLAGGKTFAETSHPEDQLFTIIFNEQVRLGLPRGVEFTQSQPLVHASLSIYPPGGRTALYDAVFTGLDHLDLSDLQKKVLVVLSDGEDNASRRSKADMLHRASRSEALIYTIWTGSLAGQPGDRGVLRDLADRTGGLAYTPGSEAEVVEAFKQIAINIRRGYSIGYVPTNTARNGEYRQVKVTVRVPGEDLTVRARHGYTASGGPDAP